MTDISTHDPLCQPPWNYGSGGHCEGCDIIGKARADEREQAAQRVQLMLRVFRSGFQPYTAFMVGMEHGMNCAIAAARGEA